MNWSGGALKATVGGGGLCAMVAWLEFLHPEKGTDPGIGFWLWISGAFVPFLIFLFVGSDEMPKQIVHIAHATAVLWYLALVVATVGLMAYRGFQVEAGKKRLTGDTARAATTDEVKDLRRSE